MGTMNSTPRSPDEAVRTSGVRLRARLAGVVLVFDAFVLLFVTLVLYGMRFIPSPQVWVIGGVVLVVDLLAAALVRRGAIGYWLGWAVQVALLAAGFFSGYIMFVALLFIAMWMFVFIAGARAQREADALAGQADSDRSRGKIER